MRTLYDVLEIHPAANQAAIEAAFRARLLEYQPHRLAELGEVSRQFAEQEREWMQYAYDVLRDPDARSDYDAELTKQGVRPKTLGEMRQPENIFTSDQKLDEVAGNSFWRGLYYLSIALAVVGALVVVWAKFKKGD